MSSKRNFGFLGLALAASAGACQRPVQQTLSSPLNIIGQDTTVAIDKTTALNPLLQAKLGAIGKMTGGCTTFHIGHGLVVTAGHCLNLSTAEWADASCHNLTVVWGQTLAAQDLQHSRCTKIIRFQYDTVADFAILEVDPAPSVSLDLQNQESVQNFADQAIVIGYPKDKSLSSSGTCDMDWGPHSEDRFFRHHCDTLPGNSGSPIFNAATAKVIGVHDGEANEQENYGSLLPDATAMVKLFSQIEGARRPGKDLSFGPFADKMTKNLINFGSKVSATVSFDLNYDIETNYDKLLLIDGDNRSLEFSGAHSEHFEKLRTPVSIVVLTDYSGTSQSVTLSAINYN